MKFRAPVKNLGEAIALAARLAPSREIIPILCYILVEAGEGHVSCTGNDLDKCLRATSDATVDRPGLVAVPAKLLAALMSRLKPDAEVDFELDAEKPTLKIRCGRSRFTLPTLPAADFPIFSAEPPTSQFTVDAKTLAMLLSDVAHAISTEETRYYLNGVFLHIAGDPPQLVAAATDGNQLSVRRSPLPAGAEKMPPMIIPRLAAAEFAKLAAAHKSEARIGASASKLTVDFGAVSLTTKLIDGTFPDYSRVIPANPHHITVGRDALSEAIQRVALLSSEARRHTVALSFDGAWLRILSSNSDGGAGREEIELECEAPVVEIGFSARYLTDALAPIRDGEVTIEISSPQDPALFRDGASRDRFAVIMPRAL